MPEFEVHIPAERKITVEQREKLAEVGGRIEGGWFDREGGWTGRVGGDEMRLPIVLIVPAASADAARLTAREVLGADADEAESWNVSPGDTLRA